MQNFVLIIVDRKTFGKNERKLRNSVFKAG